MAFKKRNSVIHGTRIHDEILALNYDACDCRMEDGRSPSAAFQHNGPLLSNKFMGERNEAIKAGKETFTVDNKTYKVTGDKKPFPKKYKNGYSFKSVCMDPNAANYGQEVPDEEMGGGNYTMSYDG
mgnify:CR=1 FL=1|tara:strand:- start:171 stop:548 length:378 start_codon:yes stop_codon:yes gene_type:complete